MTVRILKKFGSLSAVLILTSILVADVVPRPGTLWDKRDEGLWKIGIVTEDSSTLKGVQQFFSELLRSSGTRPKVVIVTYLNDRADALRYQAGPPPEATYDDAIRALRLNRPSVPFRVAELTAIDKNIVLKRTDGKSITRTVLHGRDPTLFSVGGLHCELLEIYFNRLPRPIRADGRNPAIVTAFVRTDSLPSIAEAQEVARSIQRLTGHSTINVRLRTDTWFLAGAPLWYPFTTNKEPPTHEQYVSRGEVLCNGDEAAIRCSPVRFVGK